MNVQICKRKTNGWQEFGAKINLAPAADEVCLRSNIKCKVNSKTILAISLVSFNSAMLVILLSSCRKHGGKAD